MAMLSIEGGFMRFLLNCPPLVSQSLHDSPSTSLKVILPGLLSVVSWLYLTIPGI